MTPLCDVVAFYPRPQLINTSRKTLPTRTENQKTSPLGNEPSSHKTLCVNPRRFRNLVEAIIDVTVNEGDKVAEGLITRHGRNAQVLEYVRDSIQNNTLRIAGRLSSTHKLLLANPM